MYSNKIRSSEGIKILIQRELILVWFIAARALYNMDSILPVYVLGCDDYFQLLM